MPGGDGTGPGGGGAGTGWGMGPCGGGGFGRGRVNRQSANLEEELNALKRFQKETSSRIDKIEKEIKKKDRSPG